MPAEEEKEEGWGGVGGERDTLSLDGVVPSVWDRDLAIHQLLLKGILHGRRRNFLASSSSSQLVVRRNRFNFVTQELLAYYLPKKTILRG